jgi:hypothetical protein
VDGFLLGGVHLRLPDYDWVAGSGAEAVFSLKAAPSQDVEDSSTGDQQRIVQDRQDVSVRPGTEGLRNSPRDCRGQVP